MTNYEKLRALADWFDAYDTKRLNPMIGNNVQNDLRAMANEFEQLQQHNVGRSLPTDYEIYEQAKITCSSNDSTTARIIHMAGFEIGARWMKYKISGQ